MTEKQTDNILPDLQNRFKFCKISVLTALLFLFAAHFTSAQTWSEPAVIYSSNKYSVYPDFTIDNDGNLHCVWSTRHWSNYYRIYYSRSTDDGETWSNPISPSQNSSLEMSLPHIVCDTDNHLHLTYYHDVGSIYNTSVHNQKRDSLLSVPVRIRLWIHGMFCFMIWESYTNWISFLSLSSIYLHWDI